MKNSIVILIFISLLLNSAGCNDQTASKPKTVERTETYKLTQNANKIKSYSKGSFSIDYPGEWQLDPSGANRTSFIVLSPRSGKQDNFQENVSLMINDISSYGYTMEQFVDISIGQIKEVFLKPNIISSEPVQDERGPSHRIVYTGSQRNMDLKYMQRYWIVDGKSYILTYSAQNVEFDKYLVKAQEIFDSFTIN